MEELLGGKYMLMSTSVPEGSADDLKGNFCVPISSKMTNAGYSYGTLIGIESKGHRIQISIARAYTNSIKMRQYNAEWSEWKNFSLA